MVKSKINSRKGIGYMIEGIIAAVTIFIFAFGQMPAEPSQDWSSFQNQITANDLGYTLKKTGDMTVFLKNKNTGSMQTAVSSMTEEQLEISGTIDNLPLNDASIGFTSTNLGSVEERHIETVSDVQSGDRCYGDLEEIEPQSGTSIKKTEDPGEHSGVVLYFADTDSQISGGTNSEIDYDTVYVDNQTRCQFSESEGPYYKDEIIRWNTSTSGEYEYYDVKDIDGSQNQFTYYNASLPVELKQSMSRSVNGINNTQTVDTFNLSTDGLDTYEMIVIKREEAIESINSNPDQETKIKEFMEEKPVFVIANLSKPNVENDFIEDVGLEWMDLSYSSNVDEYEFSESPESSKLETYFYGFGGDITNLDLPPGGKISSSNSNSLTQDNPLLYAKQGKYETDPWNATNNSMEPANPSEIEGVPESACYSLGDSSLTNGTFSFPEEDSNTDAEYDVINAQMGSSTSECGVVRSLSIDLNKNNIFSEEDEGPLFSGERIIIENKRYSIDATESESAQFIFTGNDNPEIINYRSSFESFSGDQLARAAYQNDYSEDNMRILSSTAYWLLGDTTEFGPEDTSSVSTTVLGSMNENVYMPYKVSLRWR